MARAASTPFAQNHFRKLLRLLPPNDGPEFAIYRALPEDKLQRLSEKSPQAGIDLRAVWRMRSE